MKCKYCYKKMSMYKADKDSMWYKAHVCVNENCENFDVVIWSKEARKKYKFEYN